MSNKRFRAQSVKLVNAAPAVTLHRVYEQAGMEPPLNSEDTLDFCRTFRAEYETGTETAYMPPQWENVMPINYAQEILRSGFREAGLVIIPLDSTAIQEARLRIEALTVLRNELKRGGGRRIQELRRTHQVSRDELDDFKDEWFPYFLNEARAELVDEEIKRLRGAISGKSEKHVGDSARRGAQPSA